MEARTVALGVCVVAALSTGCSATTRHKVLTFLFDGVPPPRAAVGAEVKPAAPSGNAAGARPIGYREHGPYAAKMCAACHDPGATNAIVAPGEQLCFRCHELRLDKRYVHGPLASGGCLVCHDPHSSQYRYLLVSESDGFCFHCHDRDAIMRLGAHGGSQESCTSCHDAHMSDKKYLLK